MAAIVERQTGAGDRRLYVVFHATDRARGSSRKVWLLSPGPGKKEANALKAQVEVDLRKSGGRWPIEEPQPEPATFAAYFAEWLERRAKHRVTPRVLDNYKRTDRLYLSPAFGTVELPSLKRKHINDLVASLAAAGAARNTIRNTLVPLRAALNDAVDDELVAANVAARIEIPDKAPCRKAIVPTMDELTRIVAKADEDSQDVIRLIAGTGLRRGEAFGLTWADVDFDNGVLRVERANHRGVVTAPKTEAGRRMVPLFGSVRQLLAARKLRLAGELTTAERPVFANSLGGWADPGNWYRRSWKPAVEAASVREFHVHDLRHFAASALDEQGMSAKLRSEIIGHTDPKVTDGVYTHVGAARIAAAAGEYDPLGTQEKTG